MSRRRRKSGGGRARRVGLWLAGAALGGAAAYLFFGHGAPESGTIPVPGEVGSREDAAAPREEIRESDRQALDKVLREHGR